MIPHRWTFLWTAIRVVVGARRFHLVIVDVERKRFIYGGEAECGEQLHEVSSAVSGIADRLHLDAHRMQLAEVWSKDVKA